MWSLLGAELRLHYAAGFSCAPSAALLALVILLSLSAAQSSAVARDAADQRQTSDANQPDYNAGLLIAALVGMGLISTGANAIIIGTPER